MDIAPITAGDVVGGAGERGADRPTENSSRRAGAPLKLSSTRGPSWVWLRVIFGAWAAPVPPPRRWRLRTRVAGSWWCCISACVIARISTVVRLAQVLEQVQRIIVVLRGHRVILDADLATLYGVENRTLLQAVRRNLERFPADFMFQLTLVEAAHSRSQTVILNAEALDIPSETAARPVARGKNTKYLPYAFTEQGVAMLSSVLRSPRAIEVNIEIMRAFVRLRRWLLENRELAERLDALERRYDSQFKVVFDAIRELMTEPDKEPGRVGFRTDKGD